MIRRALLAAWLIAALATLGFAQVSTSPPMTGWAISNAVVAVLPTNPTGTTSTAADVMVGLSNQAGTQVPAFTPRNTGRMQVTISGSAGNATSANGVRMQIQYGTGTAPTNGAASTGTSCSQRVTLTRVSTNSDAVPFSLTCIATGLTVGTAYWIDLRFAAITGGTGQLSALTVSAAEF